ncbi:MAG: amidase domain-containing protein [Faecalibacterium sp.]|nr:amidase domain-containing protein [Ruminococcus sp.]MCM1391236.1 amidase domain-containing protein [Ruminococcus sp.]MCM1484790.1 amidase domain-containing protein [Faecalibacterium sp.]
MEKKVFKKTLIVELIVLCMLCCLCTISYAVYDPEDIPEEELSAVAEDYYDEFDKRVDEKIKILDQLDNTIKEDATQDDYIRQARLLLDKPIIKDYKYALPQLKSSYANYNRENAAAYALKYADTFNSTYKKMDDDKDCTNFVSQAIAVGGVYSYINSDFNSKPLLIRDWILDSSPNYWYMIKKSRTLGSDYWQYSRSWSFVPDFRTFHIARSAGKDNYFSGKLTSGGSNNDKYGPNKTKDETNNFEYKLRKYAKVGQVWQSGDKHSIIITKVTKKSDEYNYVWYSCHSKPKKNVDIQEFFNWVYKDRNNETIHRLDFS